MMTMTNTRTIEAGLTPAVLEETRAVLRSGGVIAMPTESFYALGVSPLDAGALARLTRIKGREDGKPILILVADRASLGDFVSGVPPSADLLMQAFWPGPLTIVLPACSGLPDMLTAGTGTIGVRQPDHRGLVHLLREVGPLTGTSANRSGAPPAQSAAEVQVAVGGEIDVILDGGRTAGGLASTVVTTVGTVRVLREGRIPREKIVEVLARSGFGLSSQGSEPNL
jgi:L-threonylcarbamoyladenylate synthase